MNPLKIIVFICNWGPHAAFQELQDKGAPIPPEVRMVRIPCTGRISKSLLYRGFEMGADGVALIGCDPGSCRYGNGTKVADMNISDARNILELLGLGAERLRWTAHLPEESAELLAFLQKFRDDLEKMGKSPVAPVLKENDLAPVMGSIAERLVDEHNVSACQDCGKCSSACPLTLVGKPFSPRGVASAIIGGSLDSPIIARDVWSCLTCGLCYDRCPSAVDFPGFIRDMRAMQRECEGCASTGREAHGGFFQSLMRTMASKDVKPKRWENLPEDVRVDPDSKMLFFGGCAPYFDAYFKNHIGVSTTDILYDSLRLLNFFDVFPAVHTDERCCGHDLLWSGDRENFLRLARLNVEAMRDAGIEEVVTACPECFRTLAHGYPALGVETGFKVTHIYDRIEAEISKGAVGFKELDRRLTFQDPCRLSRMENRADLPRKLLDRLNPTGYKEMKDYGASALCCGNCAWVGCDSYSKTLQVKRLRQAHETGSDLLVTACPKCQIHLRCAMEDPFRGKELAMDVMDLTSVLAKTIQWE